MALAMWRPRLLRFFLSVRNLNVVSTALYAVVALVIAFLDCFSIDYTYVD